MRGRSTQRWVDGRRRPRRSEPGRRLQSSHWPDRPPARDDADVPRPQRRRRLPAGRAGARKLRRKRAPAAREARLDPTAPDIHLGHTVVLQKLREFQDAGHTVVLIVGDYTARVGDPSRPRRRPGPCSRDAEIDANAATYQEQAFKVLDPDRVEVRPQLASGSTCPWSSSSR